MRKERCGERGTPAQGQPGLEGEGHAGSQGRRDVLEQGPTHAAGKMLTCLNVDWTLSWDIRLEGRLSGPVPEPWGVCHLGSALRGAGSEDEPGASDAQRGCPTAGLVSPVICGWDSPTHRSMNGGITVPRYHPVTRTGLLRRHRKAAGRPPCPSPLLPAEQGSGRSLSWRWFRRRRGRSGWRSALRGSRERSPPPASCPRTSAPSLQRLRSLRGPRLTCELPAFFPRVSPFSLILLRVTLTPRQAGLSRAASWRDLCPPEQKSPCCPTGFPPVLPGSRGLATSVSLSDGPSCTARVAFEHEMHAAGEAEGAGD